MQKLSYSFRLAIFAALVIILPHDLQAQSPEAAKLIAESGCSGCHSSIKEDNLARSHAPDLSAAGQRYSPSYLLLYLQNPTTVLQNIGRSQMPDFRLSEKEALALALYLANKTDPTQPRPDFPVTEAFTSAQKRYKNVSANDGQQLFLGFNCISCHQMDSEAPWQEETAPDLTNISSRVNPQWLRDWLHKPQAIRPFGYQPGSGGRHPDFHFSEADAALISDYLTKSSHLQDRPRKAQGLTTFQQQKASKLLAHKLSCIGCHQIGNSGGRIGPNLNNAGIRLQPGFIEKMIRDPHNAVPGTVMPKFEMPEEQIKLIAAYLSEQGELSETQYLSPLEHQSLTVALRDNTQQQDYRRYCAPCHGVAGKGDGFNATFLPVKPTVHDSTAYMQNRADDTLYDGIFAGGYILNRSHTMPAWGSTLSDQQIRELVEHMRSLCDCSQPDWAREVRGER